MSSLFLLLLSCLVGVAHSCSCARRRYNAEVCDDRVKYIIKVKIEQDLDDKESAFDDNDQVDEDSYVWPPLTTIMPTTSTTDWYRIRRVRAKILHFYKGKGELGTEIILESGMMDSMCGIGAWLNPGEKFALSTNSLEVAKMGLCSFNFVVGGWEWDQVEPVLKNHDCDCKLQACRMRVNRKVLRGMCKDTAAYCAQDDKGKCRWYNAESIESCRLPPYMRRN